MSYKIGFINLLLLCTSVTSLQAGRPTYIELKTKTKTIQGRVETKDKQSCWLLDRDGQLNGLNLSKVKKYRTLSATFSPYSVPELKSRLAKELGKEFKIASDGYYIVCASKQNAKAYAELFDNTYRSFKNYFSRKGFQLPRPEFPLVAIIFPDYNSFANYQIKEGFRPSRGMLGYYLRTSNRVALYESGKQSAQLNLQNHNNAIMNNQSLSVILTKPNSHSYFSNKTKQEYPIGRINKSSNSLEATIIHEATHQIAFNTGLHSRVGDTPKWIIEGLATVFEEPGIRNSKTTVKAMQRVNKERYIWFRNYISKRRKEKSLIDFISSDQNFRSSNSGTVLDAYSEAWALTFFLLETRPVKYARYLRKIAARKKAGAYPAQERIDNFKSVFGNGISKIEIDFIRYIERL